MLVSYTRGGRFEPFYCNDIFFVTELAEFSENLVKPFRKNPIVFLIVQVRFSIFVVENLKSK